MNNILKDLEENGISILPNFVRGPMLFLLQQECDKILQIFKENNDYLFGTACRIGSIEENKTSIIGQVFDAPLIWETAREFYGSINFSEIFITHEWQNDKGMERNGFLHFDRLHTLKFMIYLTDVSEKNGPFSCFPGKHKLGKELREKGWKQTKDYSKVKNRFEIDFPELGLTNQDAKPILGNAGDLIVFDTDTPHFGGVIENGFERKLIRLHVRA